MLFLRVLYNFFAGPLVVLGIFESDFFVGLGLPVGLGLLVGFLALSGLLVGADAAKAKRVRVTRVRNCIVVQ
jgi:hypothetical protein